MAGVSSDCHTIFLAFPITKLSSGVSHCSSFWKINSSPLVTESSTPTDEFIIWTLNPARKLRRKLFHVGDLWYISSFQGQVINQSNSDIRTCRREHESEEVSDKDFTVQAAFLGGCESLTCVMKLQVSGLKIPRVLTTCMRGYKTFLGSVFGTRTILCCGLSMEEFNFPLGYTVPRGFLCFSLSLRGRKMVTRNQVNHLYWVTCNLLHRYSVHHFVFSNNALGCH